MPSQVRGGFSFRSFPVKEKQLQKSAQTRTEVQSQNQNCAASSYELLEPVEEKVIRMHYGLSESDDKRLEYAVGASEDARLKVTLMEVGNIADLDGNVPVAAGADTRFLRDFAVAHKIEG